MTNSLNVLSLLNPARMRGAAAELSLTEVSCSTHTIPVTVGAAVATAWEI